VSTWSPGSYTHRSLTTLALLAAVHVKCLAWCSPDPWYCRCRRYVLSCNLQASLVQTRAGGVRRWTATGDCCFDAARGHVCLARARTALLGLGIPSPGRLLACLAPFALSRSPRGARAERFSMLRKLTITEPHASALELRFCGGGGGGGGETGAGAAPGEAAHQQGAPLVVSGGSPWASAATGGLRLERLVIPSCAATEIKARHGCRARQGHGIASAESQQAADWPPQPVRMHGEPATLCATPLSVSHTFLVTTIL